jgi:hypothetical protein
MNNSATKLLTSLFVLYVWSATLAAVYFNWQFAKENGFLRWILLGELVPSAKALVWPYFALHAVRTEPPVRALTPTQIASMELKKMVEAMNASQQATYLINNGGRQQGAGIRSYSNFERIVAYRRRALEVGRKVNSSVLDGIYPELGNRFQADFLTFLQVFLQACDSNSDSMLKEADEHNDKWADWYQAHQSEIQAATDRALGY